MIRTIAAARAAELGAVLHLPLDDESGTTARATIGPNGTYVGGPTLGAAGPSAFVPVAATMAGDDDVASVAYTPAITVSTGAAAEAWVHVTVPGKGAFLKVGYAGGFGFGLGSGTLDAAGSELVGIFEAVRWIATGVTLTGGWHHVAMNVEADGSTASFFVDGGRVAQSAGAAPAAASGDFYAGGYNIAGMYRYHSGRIAAASLHDRPLTDAEVRANYLLGLDPRGAGSVSPVRY